MTTFFRHSAAAIAALLITVGTILPVATAAPVNAAIAVAPEIA